MCPAKSHELMKFYNGTLIILNIDLLDFDMLCWYVLLY